MNYLGSKYKLSKEIVKYIKSNYLINNFSSYVEPFCGTSSVAFQIIKEGLIISVILNDISADLILMFEALKNDWIPPYLISEDKYKELKNSNPSALRSFAGFGCSWSGKFFGGYARDGKGRNYALNARNSLLKIIPYLSNCTFSTKDYRELEIPDNSIIYCDPPYANTTEYSVKNFNTEEFWNWVRIKSKNNIVIVSEYTAPDDFECVWEKEIRMNTRTKQGITARTEKVFKLR